MNTLDFAQQYHAWGWSIIPVTSDKRPAVPRWEPYQRRQPGRAELRQWFADHTNGNGIGIITGSISGLIVLDFDDHARESAFAQTFPGLMETRQHRSARRSGLHLLYTIDPDQRVPSRQFTGVDLLAEGRYVVAPPTRIADGSSYQVVDDRPPRRIAAEELITVIAWLASSNPPPNGSPVQQGNFAGTSPTFAGNYRTNSDAISLYSRNTAQHTSRNLALFVTACTLRNGGWSQEMTEGALAVAHAVQPSPLVEASESPEARLREARATIRSVFKRPATISVARTHLENVSRIAWSDNRAREALLQQDVTLGTAFWRVYDGLTLAGMGDGELFQRSEALERLRAYQIGRRSLDQALKLLAS